MFPRLITALVVAGLATLASIHLFFQAGESPTPAVALMNLQAGRTDSGPAELAESATPASDPIIIQLTLGRSDSVLRYLEYGRIDSAEAQNWANHCQETANTGTMNEGRGLVLYMDPETGDLRELRYDLNTNIAIREHALGSGVIRTSRDFIEYDIRRVSLSFQVDRSFRTAAQLHNLPEPIVFTLESVFSE